MTKSNYKRLGDYIQRVDVRNRDLEDLPLMGLSITKEFIFSVANIIGTDLSNYKVVSQDQFACSLMQVSRDSKIPIARLDKEKVIMSPAYPIFEVTDTDELNPQYLEMWFKRSEFDREVSYYAIGGVRGSLEWEDFCDLQLPIPSIEKQRAIVAEYNTIQNRIDLNNQLIQKLEETAQAIYKQWFVEGIDEENLPEGWRVDSLKNICSKIGSGSTPTGGKEGYITSGIALIRSTNVFDLSFSYDDLAFITETQAEKLKNVEIEENDVLFNITGVSVARCCMVPKNLLPARVNQHVMIIRAPKEENISFYLLLNLCSTESKNTLLGISQSGSTREAITKSEIEGFNIVVPESGILSKFNNAVSALFTMKEIKSSENQKLEELKGLLISKLAKVEN